MSEPVVLFDHVSFAYDGPPIVENACLTIRKNEFLCMVGPNGGGKTTLLRLMLGLLTPRGDELRQQRVPSGGVLRIGPNQVPDRDIERRR